jgi:hypothetical protein
MSNIFTKLVSYDEAFRLVTPLSPADVAARLKEAKRTRIVEFFTKERLMGRVSQSSVRLWHLTPGFGNSFAPFFAGGITREGATTVVEGEFRMHWFVKVFMVFWFGFCSLWTVLALFMGPLGALGTKDLPERTMLLLFPLFGIGMLAAGYYFVRFCKHLGRKNITFITSELNRLLMEPAQSAGRGLTQ